MDLLADPKSLKHFGFDKPSPSWIAAGQTTDRSFLVVDKGVAMGKVWAIQVPGMNPMFHMWAWSDDPQSLSAPRMDQICDSRTQAARAAIASWEKTHTRKQAVQ